MLSVDKSSREDFLVLDDQEIRSLVLGQVNRLSPPIQVVFHDHWCLDCGEVGDSRLMSAYCHMEAVCVHPGKVVQHHPGNIERYHWSNVVMKEHTGKAAKKARSY